MIGRRGKWMILIYVAFLTVLFLMCSTDLIIREPEKEIYQIAVIIEDVRDDNYGNFRKGMDQAAMEFNADVHFITLYEKMDADQQMELMSREQQDGADALIIVPADEERVVRALAEKQVTVPVVVLGSGLTGEGVAGAVTADYKKMGEQLAEEIIKNTTEDCPVLIFADTGRRSVMNRLFLEGAAAVFEENSHEFWSVTRNEYGRGFQDVIEMLEEQKGVQAVILAENPEILAETAGILAERPGTMAQRADDPAAGKEENGLCLEGVRGLYGRGSTVPILNYLDRGLITGLCVTDEFSIGYLSVQTAVRAVEGNRNQAAVVMEPYYIEKEDLREPGYEKLLFPIE